MGKNSWDRAAGHWGEARVPDYREGSIRSGDHEHAEIDRHAESPGWGGYAASELTDNLRAVESAVSIAAGGRIAPRRHIASGLRWRFLRRFGGAGRGLN